MTPGQAAYEAHRDALGGNRPWSDVREPEREVWEATAQAAIGASDEAKLIRELEAIIAAKRPTGD